MKAKFIKKFKKDKTPLGDSRIIYTSPPSAFPDQPQDGIEIKYCDNTIKTSKYTLLNFLPKNLFEQFRRIANLYFLFLCIIHFSIDSPVSPMTTLLPLLFVVIVTGLKQGYEDWKRHKEDNKVNKLPASIYRRHQNQEVPQSEIQVADVVKVSNDGEFPCDLLFLASSIEDGTCSVTTANLDGETNLKTFVVPHHVKGLEVEEVLELAAIIECQHPQANIYDFKGRATFWTGEDHEVTVPLNTENLLLRGARLKNTDYIYGLAIYTGRDTKMILNSKLTTNKFSTAERTTNYYLLFYLSVLIFEVFLCMILKYQIDWTDTTNMWYIGNVTDSDKSNVGEIFSDSFSFFILFSYIIPISLYVTLEMQKFLSSFFFEWDEAMTFEGESAICNTSDLNEELGQVQYLFTDKTGTLTENSMHFRQCSAAGVKYRDQEGELQRIDDESIYPLPKDLEALMELFLVCLALCHTVRVSKVPKKTQSMQDIGLELTEFSDRYLASSPDEKALVEAAARFGVEFVGEEEGKLKVVINGIMKEFERLQTLQFDSDRKMMSVIVRDSSDGRIWLLTKGAESSVFRSCLLRGLDDQNLHDVTMKHIDEFAQFGLRTLAVARRSLTGEEYEDFEEKLSEAAKLIHGREEAVRKVMEDVEKDLLLMGATGVEDLLQEGVQETLESLNVAGIKVWVLTGDKVETAVNIGFLSGLFKRFMLLIYLTKLDSIEAVDLKLRESEKEIFDSDGNFGLVVDGISLVLILEEFQRQFYDIGSKCSAVICCRMSPKQKAEVLRLVKTNGSKRTICAAIGDGANDVSMIQEAHLGLGIMGKEGRQAVRCSDFAFAKFRFLRRALLVHGHWYYTRIATLIHYCFYKNVAFITAQVFFTFQSAYSTESIYEGGALTLFNTTFTALPIIVFGLLEQVHSDEELLSKPFLYRRISGNRNMRWRVFITWGILGLWHSCVTYYGLVLATLDSTAGPKGGKTQDYFLFGMVLTTLVVYLCNLKLVIESKYQTLLFWASIGIAIFGFYLFYFIYCSAFPTLGIFWTFYIMHATPVYYFVFLLLIVVAFIPDILIKVFDSSSRLKDFWKGQSIRSSFNTRL